MHAFKKSKLFSPDKSKGYLVNHVFCLGASASSRGVRLSHASARYPTYTGKAGSAAGLKMLEVRASRNRMQRGQCTQCTPAHLSSFPQNLFLQGICGVHSTYFGEQAETCGSLCQDMGQKSLTSPLGWKSSASERLLPASSQADTLVVLSPCQKRL